MKLIGITGGVGAGKSTVLGILEEIADCVIVMADDVAKAMMQANGALSNDAKRIFGEKAYLENGQLNTAHIATLMYGNPQLMEEWTGIVHPMVRQSIMDMINSARDEGKCEFFFLEAALLIEEGYDEICDEVWYIYVSEEERIKRLIHNRGYTEEKCRAIMSKQLSQEKFLQKSDFVIDNNISVNNTRKQLENKLEEYKKL